MPREPGPTPKVLKHTLELASGGLVWNTHTHDAIGSRVIYGEQALEDALKHLSEFDITPEVAQHTSPGQHKLWVSKTVASDLLKEVSSVTYPR